LKELKKVSSSSSGIEIRIATDESLLLDEVFIESNGEKISLQTTINQTISKQNDGHLIKERTLLFDTKKEPEYFLVGGIHYMKQYNEKIEKAIK
jgi:hypothetical protein